MLYLHNCWGKKANLNLNWRDRERERSYIQTRNIAITRQVLCQLHAAVLSFITKWFIIIVYKSNYSVQLSALHHVSQYVRPLPVIITSVKVITLQMLTLQVGPPIDADATIVDGCRGSAVANNLSSYYGSVSFWLQQLHKLGKSSTNRKKSRPGHIRWNVFLLCKSSLWQCPWFLCWLAEISYCVLTTAPLKQT